MALGSSLREEAAVHGQHFVGALSAYILVVFFTSNRVPALFTSALAIVYSCFVFVPAMSNFLAARESLAVGRRYILEYPNGILGTVPGDFPPYLLGLYFVAWLLSVFFAVYRFKNRDSA